jgi:dihydrofolate synthase/folylpolyglutamate synthase
MKATPMSQDLDRAKYQAIVARTEQARDFPAKEESLARFGAALAELQRRGLSMSSSSITLVAGTNGKGSVAKTLECLLAKMDLAVGLYTSPHMIEPTERIRSWGSDLSAREFVQVFEFLEDLIGHFSLSHFEILTLMMAEVFFGGRIRPPVKRAVLEVGVGGRLDPTALFPHQISVVTQLGLDHVELLGGSLAAIAKEKLAIVEPASLVVHAPFPDEIREQSQQMIKSRAAESVEAPSFPYRVEHFGLNPKWIIQTPWGEAELGLSGARAVANTSVALTVLRAQGFVMEPLLPALKTISWPCRMEYFAVAGCRVFLSGDHNPQGVDTLKEILREFDYDVVHVIIGIGKNKDQSQMFERFAQLPRNRFYLTTTPFRSADLSDYGDFLKQGVLASADPLELFRQVLERCRPRDLILISGSLYLTGFMRGHLTRGSV